MIWATACSQSCFCWLYRASPSLATKNIISLISGVAIWWCPCVESSSVFWKRVFAVTSAFSWQNSVSFCPASFCTPRPNLPVTPGISWLPTFAFHYPIIKIFWGLLVLKGLVGLHRTIQLQLLQHYWSGHRLGLLWYWMVCLGNEEIILLFLRLHPSTAFRTLLLTMMATPISSKGFLPTVIDIMVIWVKFTHSSPF